MDVQGLRQPVLVNGSISQVEFRDRSRIWRSSAYLRTTYVEDRSVKVR
jgi:hypothetical protein